MRDGQYCFMLITSGSIYAYFLMYQYGTVVNRVLLLSFILLSITLRNICMYVVLTYLLILTEIKILVIKLILKGNVNKYIYYLGIKEKRRTLQFYNAYLQSTFVIVI